MSASTDAMKALTAQFYNATVAGCGLEQSTFQLFQAHTPLGTDSQDLWAMFDSVPPLSVSQYYDPSRINRLSQVYGAVVAHLIPQGSDAFRKAMGDYYSKWAAYLETEPEIPDGGIEGLFKKWSSLHMPDRAQARNCATLFRQLAIEAISLAVEAYDMMVRSGDHKGVAAYDQTYGDLQNALAGSQPQHFSLDSRTESSDIAGSWAKAEVSGLFDFFYGGGGASYEKWTTSVVEAGLNISIDFAKLVQFASGPLISQSDDPILAEYTPWFNGQALAIGYKNNDNTVWQHGAPTWAGVFGPEGRLKRFCSALVVVDGITVSQSSTVNIATSEREDFKTAAEAGIFPFFKAQGSGGWTHDVSFTDGGGMTITSESSLGNPQILGAIVTPIKNIFGG
jgi:hypothetical protein